MSIHVAPGSDIHNTIRPAPCPAREGWRETVDGFLSGGRPDNGRLVKSFRNGCYQHILFLGIGGFVICNHWDKEILVLDPWPTYASHWTDLIATCDDRSLTEGSTAAKQRLAHLASFLRRGVEQGYSLSGILVSHMHFDHAEDIIRLLELLAADSGSYTDHRGRTFELSGAPVERDALPRVCCDYDCIVYFMLYNLYVSRTSLQIHGNDSFRPPWRLRDRSRFWYGNEDYRERCDSMASQFQHAQTPAWSTIKRRYMTVPGQDPLENDAWLELTAGGQRLHYDDSYNNNLGDINRACKAGQACRTFTLDHFKISPYVWDHMNTGAVSRYYALARDEQTAGALQRITAFKVEHDEVGGAKRSFFVGSSGEMNEQFTGAMVSPLPKIETDLLVQSIVMRKPSWVLNFRQQTAAALTCMMRNITVNDALMFIHWEEFTREVASTSRYKEDFDEAVSDNLASYRERLGELRSSGDSDKADRYQRLIDDNRLYALVRRNFELAMPADPEQFRDEENAHHPI